MNDQRVTITKNAAGLWVATAKTSNGTFGGVGLERDGAASELIGKLQTSRLPFAETDAIFAEIMETLTEGERTDA